MLALEERTVKVEENSKHQKCPKLLGVFYKFTASLKEVKRCSSQEGQGDWRSQHEQGKDHKGVGFAF